MKKVLSIMLLLLLGIGNSNMVTAKEYTDIAEGEEFYEAIEYASDNNIVGGYSDGTFRAYEGVTRAEFTKMLINFKYTQEEINGCKGNSFPDVAGSYVHTKYICVAKEEGILNGYSDGSFKPEQKITTPEGIKIISNTYGYTEGNSDNFDKYFEALENRSALPEASMWWPEELWRGEVMEVLYRLEESLTDREAITYNQYKEHQEWKEVVLEDAGIKFSVPSWFGMESHENIIDFFYKGPFNSLNAEPTDIILIEIQTDKATNSTDYEIFDNNDRKLLSNLNTTLYISRNSDQFGIWEVYKYNNKNIAFANKVSRDYLTADQAVINKGGDSKQRAAMEYIQYESILKTILNSVNSI